MTSKERKAVKMLLNAIDTGISIETLKSVEQKYRNGKRSNSILAEARKATEKQGKGKA